jgi:hypothetical protein
VGSGGYTSEIREHEDAGTQQYAEYGENGRKNEGMVQEVFTIDKEKHKIYKDTKSQTKHKHDKSQKQNHCVL